MGAGGLPLSVAVSECDIVADEGPSRLCRVLTLFLDLRELKERLRPSKRLSADDSLPSRLKRRSWLLVGASAGSPELEAGPENNCERARVVKGSYCQRPRRA